VLAGVYDSVHIASVCVGWCSVSDGPTEAQRRAPSDMLVGVHRCLLHHQEEGTQTRWFQWRACGYALHPTCNATPPVNPNPIQLALNCAWSDRSLGL
jgi:hypothetical protein